MSFENEVRSKYGELLVSIYSKIRDTFAPPKLHEALTNETLDFKARIMNIRRLKRIANRIEDLIDNPDSVIHATLKDLRQDMVDIGQSPGLARDIQKVILTIVEIVDEGQDKLRDYRFMLEGGFCTWFANYCQLEPNTVTPYKLLYESYKVNRAGGEFLNPKRFSSVLQALGAKPGIVDIEDKTTRVYKGVGFIIGKELESPLGRVENLEK